MNKRILTLLAAVSFIFILHIGNAVRQAGALPNCIRTYSEGMNAQFLTFEQLINPYTGYSPLYESSAYLAYKLVGYNWSAIYLIANTPCFILMLVFLFLLGKEARDGETGLLAALIVSLYPLTAAAYNRYCMEFPLLALLAMFLYFLHRSDYFLDIRYSILAGLTLITGVFVKEPFAAFVAGPLLYVTVLGLLDLFKKRVKRLFTLLIIVGITIELLSLYFGMQWVAFLFYKRMLFESTGTAWYSFDNLRLFWMGLWENQLSFLFFLLLLPSIYIFARAKISRHVKITVFLVLAVSDLFVIFMPHWKTERYLLPQLPAWAIISAFGMRKLIDNFRGTVIAALIVVLGIIQVFDFTYGKIGLSTLSIGSNPSYPYWAPADMTLLLRNKINNTELPVKISKALLKDIHRAGEQGIKDTPYRVSFIPYDWSLEAYTVRSYFLLNSDLKMEEARKAYIIEEMTKDPDYLPQIDYIVQILPRIAFKKPLDISRFDKFKNSFYLFHKDYYDTMVPDKWAEIEHRWIEYSKNFRYCGLACSNGFYDVYLFRNTAEEKK